MRLAFVVFILFILSSNPIFGAELQGKVFDFELQPVKGAVVEIFPTPQQRIVTLNGSYHFSVPSGKYVIEAYYQDLKTREEITVPEDGTFTLDLILFPSFSDEEELLNESTLPTLESEPSSLTTAIIGLIILLCIGLAGIYFFRRSKKTEPPKSSDITIDPRDDLKQVISLIQQGGARITQKDLRKRLGLSESKISLMITELESCGVVKKIKKGRGNIIILEKRDFKNH